MAQDKFIKSDTMDVEEQTRLNKLLDVPTETTSEFPPVWDHTEIGNKILGVVSEVKWEVPVKSKHSETGNVLVMETPDGNKFSIWMPKVLENYIRENRIKPGDSLAIKSLGKPTGKKYYDFNIAR